MRYYTHEANKNLNEKKKNYEEGGKNIDKGSRKKSMSSPLLDPHSVLLKSELELLATLSNF